MPRGARAQPRNGIIMGGGATTFEKITTIGQMVGIVLPSLLTVVFRVAFWLLFAMAALAIGEQSGGLIAVVTGLYLLLAVLLGWNIDHKTIAIALVISGIMCCVDAFHYWPKWIQWSRVDTQLVYKIDWAIVWTWRTWTIIDWGKHTEWIAATSSVIILRIIAVLFLPLVAAIPLKLAEWATRIETVLPEMRNTRFAAGDPGSVDRPTGYEVEQARGKQKANSVPGETETVIIETPGPEIQGA